MADIIKTIDDLRADFQAGLKSGQYTPRVLLKDSRLKALMKTVGSLNPQDRRLAGQALNDLKKWLQDESSRQVHSLATDIAYLDVTAPLGLDAQDLPPLMPAEQGSIHPLMQAQAELVNIFNKMGFFALESRQLDNEFYMFDSLNFPPQHPARDEFDTFLLLEKDDSGKALIAPAHTSTMQNRVLRERRDLLSQDRPIAAVIPGRVFRHEDVDASHDHMFYQLEGIYVDRQVTVANLIATLKEAMSAYFCREMQLKIQPFYFPFTEPSFEFAISCPFCQDAQTCRVCNAGWIELLGCGMIHPRVLQLAGIDPQAYNGFAWGLGINRLVMIRHGIEDIRHFTTGRLEFLRQF